MSGGPLRLLHIITDLELGGAETMLMRLAQQLQARGHDNLVLTLMAGGRLAPQLAAAGVRVEGLGLGRGQVSASAAWRLGRICRAFRPSLIQGWMYHGNLAASLARRLARTPAPALWGIHHSLGGPVWPKRSTRALIRAGAWLSRDPAGVIYCSATSARQHEQLGYARPRTAVIPNGIDGGRFRPDPAAAGRLRALLGVAAEVPLIGLFARLDPMKDHATLLAAMALLRARGIAAHLVLAGSDVEEGNAALGTAIAAAGLTGQVSLLGTRDDVEQLMPGLDAFALSSAYGEAFPLVLIEAMAAGVPCVATDVGDSALILAGVGEIVPPRAPEALATALARLLAAAPEERARRGAAARARVVERYALPAIATRYEQLYARLLTVPGSGRAATNGIEACAD